MLRGSTALTAIPLYLLFALIAVALLFDLLNGLHDAANSIATIVSTRVLSPRLAVIWAAFFNFIAFLFFGLSVANTVGSGIIDPNIVDPAVIFAALTGAIIWNLVTWFAGIPSSSSHALIGGLVGAGAVKGGLSEHCLGWVAQNSWGHRLLAGSWLRPGPLSFASDRMGFRPLDTAGGGQLFPSGAVRLCLVLFARAWRQ